MRVDPSLLPQRPRLPSRLPRPEGELAALEKAWQPPRGWRVLSAVDNTHIGLFYIGTSLFFFVAAGVLALLIRAQLAVPNNDFLSPALYNQIFTMHGTVMMFLFAVPVVEAIAVFVLPGMLGARDLPFPRLSAYAFWAYAVGGLAFFLTIFFAASPDGGWFMYPPLTNADHSPGRGADWWLLGIGFIEISAIAGAIELIIGILFTRAPGMTLGRMPIFAWAMLVVGAMIVFAFPAIIAGTVLLELERAFDWPFFQSQRGGDPLLWQHLFWFFGHPEVYIIFLPAAGLVSMMVPTLARTPLVGYRAIVLALGAVGFFSFALWAHHMYTAGLSTLSGALVSAASMAVAVPTGIQVFAWLATIAKGQLRINGASLFLLGFFFIFVIGGLTGVMVAVLPFDWQVHDTYFVVAHFHYVLIGGMVFPIFAGLYHWTPLLNGRTLSEPWAKWVFGLMFGGFNLAFFPMHISGLLGMPRRVQTYAAGAGLETTNLLSSIGAAIFALGVVLFAIDAFRTWRRSDVANDDPWRSGTLEWLPTERYGTRSIPQVDSREPLWSQPTLAAEVVAGQHWLPGTATGKRETIVTSPRRAVPTHLIVLPGDSWLPIGSGVGTAAFFLLLTVEMYVPAVLFAVLAVAALIAWLWQTDRCPDVLQVEVADGVSLPVGAPTRRSHSWWAVVVLVVVMASIFASFVFAHLHVSLRAVVCPPPGAALPADATAVGSLLAWLASTVFVALAARVKLQSPEPRAPLAMSIRMRVRFAVWVAAASVCALAGLLLGWQGHAGAGLAPARDAWSATIAALLAWQAFLTAVLSLMAAYLVARAGSGRLGAHSRASLDNVALFWHATALQGAFGIAFVQWLPIFMP